MITFRQSRLCAALLLLSTSIPAPAVAQLDEAVEIDRQTALIVAKTNLEAAQNARVAAQVEALGLSSGATGATEIKEKGGEFEAWLLSAKSIEAAADQIVEGMGKERSNRTTVLLAGTEPFDLALARTVKARLQTLEKRLRDDLTVAGCLGPQPPFVAAGVPVIPLIGALVGALKTDTQIYGAEGPSDARMLVNAMTRRAGNWLVPADVSLIPDQSDIGGLWETVTNLRATAVTCKGQPKIKKAQAALLTAAVALVDQAEADLVATGTGTSPLIQAIRLDAVAKQNPLVMRLFVEKGGGSILLRKNLWTALGAPAVGITGGSVVSWRLVDPASGKSEAGGLLLCRTKLTNMRAVHAGRTGAAACTPAS